MVCVGYEDAAAWIHLRAMDAAGWRDARTRDGRHSRAITDPARLSVGVVDGPLFAPGAADARGLPDPTATWGALWARVRATGAAFVVIDPAALAVDTGLMGYAAGPVSRFYAALRREAGAAGCAVLLVCHMPKATRAKPAGEVDAGDIAGSAAWVDRARSALTLTRDSDRADGYVLTVAKANYARTGTAWALTAQRAESGRPLAFEGGAADGRPGRDPTTDPIAARNRRALARATADPAGALAALLAPAGRGALCGAARAFTAAGRTPAADRIGALLWRVQMREQMIELHTHPEGGMPAATAAAFRMEEIRAAHAVRAGGGLTALAVGIEAGGMRPAAADPFRPRPRASLPRLHRVTVADARALAAAPETLPGFSDSDGAAAPDHQAALPGFETAPAAGCPSWILWLWAAGGGPAMTRKATAPPHRCGCSWGRCSIFACLTATANGGRCAFPWLRLNAGSIRADGRTGAGTGATVPGRARRTCGG